MFLNVSSSTFKLSSMFGCTVCNYYVACFHTLYVSIAQEGNLANLVLLYCNSDWYYGMSQTIERPHGGSVNFSIS